MGCRQSFDNLQWLTYIVRSRNNVSHAGNRRVIRLAVLRNLKVYGYCAEANEVIVYTRYVEILDTV